MAKYTELFATYLLNGGQVPAIFSEIQGFTDLFIGEYADKEIGFETPALFELKLECRANLIMPPYVARIAQLKKASDQLFNPSKKRVKTGNITREYGEQNETNTQIKNGEVYTETDKTTTITLPDHVTNTYENPMTETADIPENIPPSNVVIDTASVDETKNLDKTTQNFKNYEDKNTRLRNEFKDKEVYQDITDTESGFSSAEAAALYQSLQSEVFIIERQLLNEFSRLFMKVY